MILVIFSESLPCHIKIENYNADYNSKNLITFCKNEAHKIYKNFFFAKFISCTLKKIYLVLESNVLFKVQTVENFEVFIQNFKISNEILIISLKKVFSQNKFKNNLKDFVTKNYNKYTSQEFIKILLVKNLLFTLYKNIFIC